MRHLTLAHTKTARFLHWFNMFCITMLTLTGFYIHSPFQFNIFPSMDMARKLHFILMYLVIYSVAVRVYYSYYKKDYKDILFSLSDIKGFLPLIKYYLFLKDKPPETGKYNSGQKLVYTSWVFLIGIQALTGFVLYFPTALAGLGQLMGGIVYVRLVHYLVTWVFVCTVAIHVYMSLINGLDVIKSMVTGYMPGTPEELAEEPAQQRSFEGVTTG